MKLRLKIMNPLKLGFENYESPMEEGTVSKIMNPLELTFENYEAPIKLSFENYEPTEPCFENYEFWNNVLKIMSPPGTNCKF